MPCPEFPLTFAHRRYLALFDQYLRAPDGFDARRLRVEMTAQARQLMDEVGVDVAHVAGTWSRKAA